MALVPPDIRHYVRLTVRVHKCRYVLRIGDQGVFPQSLLGRWAAPGVVRNVVWGV
jgi:hypothetical protein